MTRSTKNNDVRNTVVVSICVICK